MHRFFSSPDKNTKGMLQKWPGNISQRPWVDVAHSQKTLLTPIMVEDLVDTMSVLMAVTHFQKDEEECMRKLGYYKSASLCHDVRE